MLKYKIDVNEILPCPGSSASKSQTTKTGRDRQQVFSSYNYDIFNENVHDDEDHVNRKE